MDGFFLLAGIRSIVIGARPTWLDIRASQFPAGAIPGAAGPPAAASAGIAAIDAISSALGTVIRCPHFLQRPCFPAARGSTSNREPQLWQKNTMLIEPIP